ncbi:MAG: FG-GAP repeat domain-containing protein [Actinomycetota bacterium]
MSGATAPRMLRVSLCLPCLALAGIALPGGCDRRPEPQSRPEAPPVRLTRVDQELGLAYRYGQGGSSPFNIVELMGAGAGFLDFDNDGWLDIVCAGMPHSALFRNEEGRRFVDVTAKSGVGRRGGRWYACASADYDNDRFVDLFLTGHNLTALFRNQGDGTFNDVTDTAGVRLQRWASSAAFADVDRDGDLDLYVGCYAEFGPGSAEFLTSRGVRLGLGPDAYPAQKGVLFRNDGGRFRDVTASAGLEDVHGKALGVAFADADGDGDDDLYVANDQQPQDFMLNDGRGRFRNAALESGVAFSSEMDRSSAVISALMPSICLVRWRSSSA